MLIGRGSIRALIKKKKGGKKRSALILSAADRGEEDATVMVLIKDIGRAHCLHSCFCFLKEELSEALHKERGKSKYFTESLESCQNVI